jgi:PPE-repeat protein
LIEASAAWQQLAADLEEAAAANAATLSSLTGVWRGPSALAMTQAVQPYLTWLRTTTQQSQQTASSALAAVAAFNSVRAAVVPVAQVTAKQDAAGAVVGHQHAGHRPSGYRPHRTPIPAHVG